MNWTSLPATWVCITARLHFSAPDCEGGLYLRESATDKQRVFGLHKGLLSSWLPSQPEIIEQSDMGFDPACVWLRITCSGSAYLMAYSPDGEHWTQLMSAEALMKSDWTTYHHDQYAVGSTPGTVTLEEFTLQ